MAQLPFEIFVHVSIDYDCLLLCVITCRSDNNQYAVCVPHADSTSVAVLGTLAPSSGTCVFCPSGLAPHALLSVHDDHSGRGGRLSPRQPLCAVQTGQSHLQRNHGNRGTRLYLCTYVVSALLVSDSVVFVGDGVIQTDGRRRVSLAWLRCARVV